MLFLSLAYQTIISGHTFIYNISYVFGLGSSKQKMQSWLELLLCLHIPKILFFSKSTRLGFLLSVISGSNKKASVCKYSGSYMSAYVLLNLLNELSKKHQMRGLPSILSLFRNDFNKFNDTGARLLDSIYQMTLKFLKNRILA